jgi:hypothetical protein
VVDAGPDQTIIVNTRTMLPGTATDPDGDAIVGWLWSVDSAPAGSSPSIEWPNEPDPMFISDVTGDYVLSLIATDGAAWSEPDYVTIHVRELLEPEAVINVDVTSGPAPLTVQFDGSDSTVDPMAEPLMYTWSFGDSSASSAVAPAHTYEFSGNYLATLTVVDKLGQAGQDLVEITVFTPGLVVDVTPLEDSVLPGETATYTVSVTNQAGITEQVTLSITNPRTGWSYTFTPTEFAVHQGETVFSDLLIGVPADASPGEYYHDVKAEGAVSGTVIEESLYLNVLTTVIPEFTTIAIPVAAVLGLFMLMQRRRKEQ